MTNDVRNELVSQLEMTTASRCISRNNEIVVPTDESCQSDQHFLLELLDENSLQKRRQIDIDNMIRRL